MYSVVTRCELFAGREVEEETVDACWNRSKKYPSIVFWPSVPVVYGVPVASERRTLSLPRRLSSENSCWSHETAVTSGRRLV